MREPQIHSHITDSLPNNHPLAEKNIHCNKCNEMVHACNNECMQTWVEAGKGNFCLACFTYLNGDARVLYTELALL